MTYARRFRLRMEAITPLHVGSGEMLDMMEYVVDKNRMLSVIDYGALVVEPQARAGLSTILSEMLSKGGARPVAGGGGFMDVARRLNSFVADAAAKCPGLLLGSYRVDEMAHRRLMSSGAVGEGAVAMLPGMPGRWYLPGSSIKGAIRTALVDQWFSGPDRERFSEEVRRGREAINRQAKEGKNREAGDAMKSLQRNADDVMKRFGEFPAGANHFRHLQVSDFPVAEQALYVGALTRVHKKPVPGETGIPALVFLLEEGSVTEGTLSIVQPDRAKITAEGVAEACRRYYDGIEVDVSDRPQEERNRTFLLQIGKFAGALTKTFRGARAINVMAINKRREIRYRLESEPLTEWKWKDRPLGWVLCTIEEAKQD